VTAAEGTGYGLLIMTRSAAFRFCFFEPFSPAFLGGKPPVRQQKVGRIVGSYETESGNTLKPLLKAFLKNAFLYIYHRCSNFVHFKAVFFEDYGFSRRKP